MAGRAEILGIIEATGDKGMPFTDLPGVDPENGRCGPTGVNLIEEVLRLVGEDKVLLDFSGPQIRVVQK